MLLVTDESEILFLNSWIIHDNPYHFHVRQVVLICKLSIKRKTRNIKQVYMSRNPFKSLSVFVSIIVSKLTWYHLKLIEIKFQSWKRILKWYQSVKERQKLNFKGNVTQFICMNMNENGKINIFCLHLKSENITLSYFRSIKHDLFYEKIRLKGALDLFYIYIMFSIQVDGSGVPRWRLNKPWAWLYAIIPRQI